MCKPAMPLHYTYSCKGDPHKQHSELQILLLLVKLHKFIHSVLKLDVSDSVPNTGQHRDYHKYTLDQLDDIFLKRAGSQPH